MKFFDTATKFDYCFLAEDVEEYLKYHDIEKIDLDEVLIYIPEMIDLTIYDNNVNDYGACIPKVSFDNYNNNQCSYTINSNTHYDIIYSPYNLDY